MDFSSPSSSVLHCLWKFAQIHVYLASKWALLQYKIKRFFKKESIVEKNLIWITFLYTWNEHNSVNQLYFNISLFFWKWGISVKRIFTVWHLPQFWTWVLCISESSMSLLTCSLAWCPPSRPAPPLLQNNLRLCVFSNDRYYSVRNVL